jgi:spermidine synthase
LVEEIHSDINGKLYVYYINGRYILNTDHANYSYQELHEAFRFILKKYRKHIRHNSKVLVLGLGGGSIIHILHKEFKVQCEIKAIEYDPEIIHLAEKYWNMKNTPRLRICHDDAYHFVHHTKEKFDLILFDIYINNNIPEKFESKSFFHALKNIMSKKGLLIYNKDFGSPIMKRSLPDMDKSFFEVFPGSVKHKYQGIKYFYISFAS